MEMLLSPNGEQHFSFSPNAQPCFCSQLPCLYLSHDFDRGRQTGELVFPSKDTRF